MIAIQKQPPASYSKSLPELLLTISVITGWRLNKNPSALETLCTQLQHKLAEDYPNITTEQIEEAFRKFGNDEDYGKTINVAQVSKVLQKYFSSLAQDSDFEERQNKFTIDKVEHLTPEQELSETRKLLEQKYQLFLDDKLQFDLLPAFGYEVLAEDFCIVPDLPLRFIGQARDRLQNRVSPYKKAEGRREKIEAEAELIGAILPDAVAEQTIKQLVNKFALEYCFEQFKNMGYTRLYMKS
jgi:regulator of sigma D